MTLAEDELLGVDLSLGDDLDPAMRDAGGVLGFAQDQFHRITTPRGRLIDDPNYGRDIRRTLHKGMTPQQVASEAKQLEGELLEDPRCDKAAVELTETEPGKWRVRVRGTWAQGPFEFVVGVAGASALLLSVEGS